MKKSQFITIVILFIAASVLICIGAFGKDVAKEPHEEPTSPLLAGSANPSETEGSGTAAPDGDSTETPSSEAPATSVPSVGTEGPSTLPPTAEPTKPGEPVDFADIKNSDFVKYDGSIQYWTSRWTDHTQGQARPTIDAADLKPMRDAISVVDYIYINDIHDYREVYLTFSVHYDNGVTDEILDTLKSYDVKATFYVTAEYIRDNPELVKRMKAEGHDIGTRGPNPTLSDDEIADLTAVQWAEAFLEVEKEYQKLFGADARMNSCRLDRFSARSLKVAEALGYKIVFKTYASVANNEEGAWQNENRDTEYVEWRLNERAAYEGSVPEFSLSEIISDALGGYLRECKEENIVFGLFNE